ncbi:MAG TPA: ATP-binding protein [Candidatus Tectomicrobia bacterium]|nr:ATP-binding protein [Candidatus Tectomicrobia bacterium]
MAVAITLKFITTVALYLQLLTLVYLYSGNRARFFRYLVWAWGLFVVSKGSYIIQHFFPAAEGVIPLLNAAGSAGDLLILAAGLAFRWDYRIRWYQAALGVAYVVLSSLLSAPSGSGIEMPLSRRVIGGSVLIAAGVAFWPWRSTAVSPRGCRFLSISFALWGLSRMATGFVDVPPDSMTYVVLNSALALFYFLSVFAIIILVLDRARGEVASLKEFNERLVDGLGEGLELVDGEFTIRHANRWMAEQFGPVVGRHCYEVLTADKRQCPGCPLARREVMDTPARLEITGPSDRRFLLTCSPVRQADGQVFLLELVSDVTEQERLRQRLSEVERLAAVGELAAGLAHEIRNPLAAILNGATLLEEEETLTAEERASILAAVKTEARRLNTTLSDFLLFARPRQPMRQMGDIGKVVEHVSALLQEERNGRAGVQVDVRVDPTIPQFAFDADQLTQVLWNIARNGVEAMQGRGHLTLNVGRHNGQVLISVADTGPGISPDEQRRIFQPFISKKPGGTGLGLAIAQRIVTAHGGRIDVESAPEHGSRFTIRLPVVEG